VAIKRKMKKTNVFVSS